MKKIIFAYLALTIGFLSCSKNDDDEAVFSDEAVESHQEVFDKAVDFIKAGCDIETAADYVKTLDGVTNVQINDDAIEVTTQGNITFVLDFATYPEFEADNVDIKTIEARIDSIDNAIGIQRANGYQQTSEVFKDYIASNATADDDQYTSATRASSVQKVRLSRKNIAIWNPWKEFAFETSPIKEVSSYANKVHTLQQFTSFSPASFNSFKSFDIIYLVSHGYEHGEIVLPYDCLTKSQLDEYEAEVKANRVKFYSNSKGQKAFFLTKTFFDKYLPDLSNTIIYTSACFLGVKDSHFLSSCLKKDVADYFGADGICTAKHIVHNFEEFYIYLMYGYSTYKAFANGRGYFIGSYVYNTKPWTYRYSRYGSKLVYYPRPIATGVGRGSGSSTRSDDDSSSSMVVNTQLVCSSEEEGDILKSIEAGICLQDMENKKVTLIPFTSKNIVSNEKKSQGDVTVSNISASLDNLTEGHQYAYCCYTKADGVVSLSEECYKISKTEDYAVILRYSYDYKHTLYGPGYTTVQSDYKDRRDSLIIAKHNGLYYYRKGTNAPCQISISPYEPLTNSVRDFLPFAGDSRNPGTGSLTITIDSDNINMKCYCDNYYLPGEYSSHFDGEINITNLDTSPRLSIVENENYSHSNRFGNFKHVQEYNYKYVGYERLTVIPAWWSMFL